MHDEVVTDVKSLLARVEGLESRLEDIQVKGVNIIRHVRDVDYWGLPYGTVIVARGRGKGEPLLNIHSPQRTSAANKPKDMVIRPGFRQYNGKNTSTVKGRETNPASYQVGKSGSKWVVIDETGKQILSASDEITALEKLNDYAWERMTKPRQRVKDKDTGEYLYGRRPLKPGERRPTADELEEHGALYSDLVDIVMYDTPKDGSYGHGYARDGAMRSFRRREGVLKKEAAKVATVRSMEKKMPKFEKYLRENWKDDDTVKALMLMRFYGMRVGTTDLAYGATQIKAGHVVYVSDKEIHLRVPSKKHKTADMVITNPHVVAAIKQSLKGKKPGDQLFPDANADKTDDIVKEYFGKNVKNHNLRHYRATEFAAKTLLEWRRLYKDELPGDYPSFVQWAKELGDAVDDNVLFDENEAWASYVDFHVLDPIAQPGWVDKFRETKWKSNKGK